MRPGAFLFLLAAGISLSGAAWKTSLVGVNRSVHEKHTKYAWKILLERAGNPGTSEWSRFGGLLEASAGTLKSDANSHGNVVIGSGERDSVGPEPITDELLTQPLTFNGGPFYRWWCRMQEANAQYNLGLPARPPNRLGVWRRDGLPTRDISAVYRYMGYMAHLVQDNCSPAHAANIRHGVYEGIEYWHWRSLAWGGSGMDLPQEDVPTLLLQMNSDGRGFWVRSEFQKYWDNTQDKNASHDSDFFDRGIWNGEQQKAGEALLLRVINDTRSLYMPDGVKLRTSRLFDFYDAPFPGRRAHEVGGRSELRNNVWVAWDYEDNSVWATSGKVFSLFGNPPANAAEPYRTAGPLLGQIYAKPQYQVDPATAIGPERTYLTDTFRTLGVGNTADARWWWETSPSGSDPFSDPTAKPLNAHRVPYLPNPDYVGHGFDLNWGSYGGYFGYPGRVPVDGDVSKATMTIDAFRADGRITPGDLYSQHVARTYDPRNNGLIDGYRDERALGELKPHPSYESSIGNAQVKNSVFWTASLLNSLSMAVPPILTHFQVEPRVPKRGFWETQIPENTFDLGSLLPVPRQGAYLSLAFAANRNAEIYQVEFYAVPKNLINEDGNRPRQQAYSAGAFLNCTRQISQGPRMALYSSDFGIEDLGGDTTETGGPPGPASPMPVYYRDYDYVHSQFLLIPLQVCWANALKPNECYSDGQITVPGKGLVLPPLLVDTNPLSMPFKSSKHAFIWDGVVGGAVTWQGAADPRGEKYLAKDPLNPSRKTLISGEYFVLAVLYRKGARWAFANNQFKLMSPLKEKLETLAWWKANWSKVVDGQPDQILEDSKRKILIPDELYPILLDSGAIKVSGQ